MELVETKELSVEDIEAMALESGVEVSEMHKAVQVTKVLKQVGLSIGYIEAALDNVMKNMPNRQVQYMLQDTHSMRAHIASFFTKGPLIPHKEVPLEASVLTQDDVDNAYEIASEEIQQELPIETEEI